MASKKFGDLPQYAPVNPPPYRPKRIRRSKALHIAGLACVGFITYAQYKQVFTSGRSIMKSSASTLSIEKLNEDLARCAQLKHKPKNPVGLGRKKNARYIDGHNPTLIKNTKVWIGEPVEGTSPEAARNGTGFDWVDADVLVQYGLIQKVEKDIKTSGLPSDIEIFDAAGRLLTAGIIDMHSHGGLGSLPSLWGSEDTNEISADITPQMRSIDSFNPLDPQLQVIKSGGVTTSLILPGSGNNMGGEAFVFKHSVGKKDGRKEISARDMLADPEQNWRYMKMACGENAKRVYGQGRTQSPWSRMGESWEFRHAFEQAAELNKRQDDWCANIEANGIAAATDYLPWDLKWESLGAALRGQVHINTHCYTVPDLEAFVDHTNEFKFPVRAFHHAHSTYLVPEILKRAYGPEPPASALFAENMYYKTEAYQASEFAGKILYDNDLTPVYVSDNPVLNAQHVLFEAAKAYKYGLPYHAALAAMTSAPAHYLGFDERLGKIKPGFDADIVVWDSDPLSAGAAPVQVWIDGDAQFEDPVVLEKEAFKPKIHNAKRLDVINMKEPTSMDDVVFTGIQKVMFPGEETKTASESEHIVVRISNGEISCVGTCISELETAMTSNVPIIALNNGYLHAPFTAVGGALGLEEIGSEGTTTNGKTYDFTRAVDGLLLDTKKLREAVKYGVTRAITAPSKVGASVGFKTGAKHSVEDGAVWDEDVAVHYQLDKGAKGNGVGSIANAVGKLRSKLLKAVEAVKRGDVSTNQHSEEAHLKQVIIGNKTLVLNAQSADIIATILKLKTTIEDAASSKIRIAIFGGAEAYILADELVAADIGVILSPIYSYAVEWQERRALTGAPLTNGTAVDVLVRAGVTTAFGLLEDWEFRVLGLNAGIAYNNGKASGITEEKALGFVSGEIYKVLGVQGPKGKKEFVISEGSPLQIESRVRGVGKGGEVLVFA